MAQTPLSSTEIDEIKNALVSTIEAQAKILHEGSGLSITSIKIEDGECSILLGTDIMDDQS